MLAIVLAMDIHGLIGKDNDLPWHYPEDLKYFKALTLGHKVLMGRKTFESIYNRLNKPLPNRENVVLTRQNLSFDGVEVIHDLDSYLDQAKEEDIYIIGGKEIFNQTIDLVDLLYVTHIKHIYEGDQYLQIDFSQFSCEIIKETDDLIFTKYSRRNK
jgi:dihydrofolate reductase